MTDEMKLRKRATIQKARPMIKTLAQSGKHSATLDFFDVHSHSGP